MSAPSAGPPSGERWNVNLPAVIGVVFVFLVGVIVWVLVRDDGNDSPTTAPPATGTAFVPATTEPPRDTVSGTTTPPPMPTVAPSTSTPPPTSAPPTTAPPTTGPSTTGPPTSPPPTVPVTAAPDAGDDAVPGDLGISGRPMLQPSCDGGYITILASAVGDQATAAGIERVLDTYPTSEYLRTDQSCASLNQDVDGDPIYIVYFGPFAFDSDACAARAEGSDDAYARRLTDDADASTNFVDCGPPDA